MTNEVANVAGAAAPCGLSDALSAQLTQGQELCSQILTWLSERGLAFAVNLVVALLILLVGMLVIKLIRVSVAKALAKVNKMSKLLSDFLVSVVSKTCWAVLALVVLQRLGVNVGPLVAGLGVTGFILGFAFQETLGSFAAGMMIALNQPFKVGDYVVAGGVEGAVLELNMMATVFATADNKKVVVPNKVVWGSAITNFSALGKRRVDTKVAVDYGTDLKKAVEVAREAIRGHEWHITRYNRVLPPEHDCILPFNRLVQGHADYTPMVFEKKELQGYSWARELAQGVVFSARFLCFGDYPQNYLDNPAVELIKSIPAEYDETRILPGSEIGKCVAVAKRKGRDWFVAVENGAEERRITIKLDFLGEDSCELLGFADAEDKPDGYRIDRRAVERDGKIELTLRPCGGYCARIAPATGSTSSE